MKFVWSKQIDLSIIRLVDSVDQWRTSCLSTNPSESVVSQELRHWRHNFNRKQQTENFVVDNMTDLVLSNRFQLFSSDEFQSEQKQEEPSLCETKPSSSVEDSFYWDVGQVREKEKKSIAKKPARLSTSKEKRATLSEEKIVEEERTVVPVEFVACRIIRVKRDLSKCRVSLFSLVSM